MRRQVLIAVGVLKFIMAIHAFGMAHSSSFSVDMVVFIFDILLCRGALRAASAVRWIAWLRCRGRCSWHPRPRSPAVRWTLTELRPYPFAALAATTLTVGYVVLALWVIRELGSAPVLEARAAAGRPVRNMRIPLALGLVFCMAAFGFMMQMLGGDRAERAEAIAAAQLGAGYHYHVNTMS